MRRIFERGKWVAKASSAFLQHGINGPLGSGIASSCPRRSTVFATLLCLVCGSAALNLKAYAQGTVGAEAAPQAVQQQAPVTNPNAPSNTPEASQNPSQSAAAAAANGPQPLNPLPALTTSIWTKQGRRVESIRFDGVSFADTDPIMTGLQQKAGQPLDPEKVRADLRSLFASGRYRDIQVSGQETATGLTLVYSGTARYYVGRVVIAGVSQDRLASLLEFATRLDPGTAYTEAEIPAAIDGIKQTLAQNGYFQPSVKVDLLKDDRGNQIDATFTINVGPQARVGAVALEGKDPGISVLDFRKKGKLDCSKLAVIADKMLRRACQVKVTRDTSGSALSGVRSYYQKRNRLEGTISLQKQDYQPPRKVLDYTFDANQGPIVHVEIKGVKISNARKKLLVPIYQESAVDNDLMNEGAYNIRDFLQQQGYFDTEDSVKLIGEGTGSVTVEYNVTPGTRHKVTAVNITGNKYFDHDLIEERLRVKRADLYVRNGAYSTQLVNADRDSIQALYRASGFTAAKVTTDVKDIDKDSHGEPLKLGRIEVTYKIEEGPQQKFGAVDLAGIDPARQKEVHDLLSAEVGQPFSLITLSNDRDAVLSYYLARGFDHARVEIAQKIETDDKTKTDVTLNVTEGQQVSIDHVLLSGLNHTKHSVVEKQMKVHAGEPLDQSALLETQRNLYNLALFSEVNAAVQNPTGEALRKNVLVQVTESKRWDVTYGGGFEAQTGTPAVVPGETRGGTAAQNGKAGASPRGSIDISRINFRGTQESITLHTSFGLLERVATLSFNNPQLLGKPNLTATVSGGYSNVQNITTFQAQTLQGDFRVTQKYKKADTFIYDFQYRRVEVDPNSLEITPNLIAQLSQPVTVGGPGFTYFHDTRDPSPLDAGRGHYYSVQEFISDSKFGAATNFNRLDLSHSSYYTFGKRKYVFARNLRVGFENTFGKTNSQASGNLGISNCQGILLTTNATCNPIPLPERLYAGGATSHRGFGINDAGPRDLTTGYPVGGSGVVVNSFELRLPPPALPLVGNSVSFVVFHDMGNVFRYPGDMFSSIKNFRQPNEETCKQIPPKGTPVTDLQNFSGTCNFNYYSHAVGLGARYKTPVGPIRVDFSYNLNPPVYPVAYDYTVNSPYVGRAGHFNFFFSIGQAF